MKKIITLLLVGLFTVNSFAQLKFGTDIYSRYIWRGLNLGGDSPAFQPSLTFTTGGLSVGAWGSYSFPGSAAPYSENDLWASFTTGPVSLYLTDYYIPSLGIPFGHFKHHIESDGTEKFAAHTLEGGIGYTGPEKFPITLSAYYNVSNDPDNSAYIQASYPVTVGDATLTLTAGMVTAASAYYGVSKGGFTNVGVTASKNVVITDKFSLPINVSYIINPSQDISFLVFGMSLTL